MSVRKLLSLILACMMCLSLCLIAGAEEIPVITIAIAEKTNVEDHNTNWTTLQLEEKLGIDIQFEVYPATDYNTKINMMIQSGGAELPDALFVTPSLSELNSWIDSGCIIPLTEYYADPEISPNLHEAVERTGVDFFAQITQPDGNIYSVPTLNQSYGNEHPYKLFYNEKWLAALDAQVPTTPEELYDLLVKVKNTDLNGNGKADEIGMVGGMNGVYPGWFSYIMNAYIYAGDSNYFVVDDEGTVTVAYNTEAWKEGLKFMAKLFAEDLIPKEILTQDNNQYLAMLNSEECTTMMLLYTSPSRINAANEWRNDFVAGQPLVNRDTGKPLTAFRPSVPNNGSFFITKNCKNPEAAFRIGDLMVSEYFGIVTRWGQEGVDWDYLENVKDVDLSDLTANVPGYDVLFYPYNDAKFWSSGEIQNRSYIQTGPYIREYAIANSMGISQSGATAFSKRNAEANVLYQTSDWNPDHVIPMLIYTQDETEVYTDIKTTLDTYRNEMTANFLAGNVDIDAEWDNYVAELENIGLSELLEVVQAAYDRMYK